jgi:hypothetical protein
VPCLSPFFEFFVVVKHTFVHVLAQLAYTGEAMLHNKTPETDGSVLGVEIQYLSSFIRTFGSVYA